jgi:hypothetical protein
MDTLVMVLVFIAWFAMFVCLSLVHIFMVPKDIRKNGGSPLNDPPAPHEKDKEPRNTARDS